MKQDGSMKFHNENEDNFNDSYDTPSIISCEYI